MEQQTLLLLLLLHFLKKILAVMLDDMVKYVLRKIFGPRKDDITGEWRKLHNEELHDLYSSPTVVRAIKRNSRHFMEPEVSLPHSQVTATCFYLEPAGSSPYPHILLLEDPS
jgi:hypothetical protein